MGDVLLRLSDIEKAGMAAAAELRGLSLSGWARMTLRQAATDLLREHRQPVPFLPAAPMPAIKAEKPARLKANEFRIDPNAPPRVADVWPNVDAWLNFNCSSNGLRFPEGDPLEGKRCYARLVDDSLVDDLDAHAALEHDLIAAHNNGFASLEAYWTAMAKDAQYPNFTQFDEAP